jgi:apolipoprotein N-acyltransferase
MTTRAVAYSRFWRLAAAASVAVSWIGLLAIAVAATFLDVQLDNPLRLLRACSLALAPGVAAWLAGYAFRARVTIADGSLIVERRDRRIEVPCASIVAVEPWSLPAPGVDLRLRSGRRFPFGLAVADLGAFLDALVANGASDADGDGKDAAALVYARSQPRARRWWSHPLAKFIALALVPTIPLFRLHQWIAYGGTFGEYYTYGLRAYALGFLLFWSTFTIYLVVYAAVLRLLAELTMRAVAAYFPARAVATRRLVERACGALYLGGLAAFLLRTALLAS